MKKRLFISSILMTLVLLVAITTATFAWYSTTVTVTTSQQTSSLATAENNVTAGSVSLSVSQALYDFQNNAVTGKKLFPATSGTDAAQNTTAGTLASIVGTAQSPLMKSYVQVGDAKVPNTPNNGNLAAYAIVTFTVDGDANATSSLGTLQLDLTKLAIKNGENDSEIPFIYMVAVGNENYTLMNENTMTISNISLTADTLIHVLIWVDGVSITDSSVAVDIAAAVIQGDLSFVPTPQA